MRARGRGFTNSTRRSGARFGGPIWRRRCARSQGPRTDHHGAPHRGARADPANFRSGKAIGAFVGTIRGLRESGTRRPGHARLHPLGHAALRLALWIPTLTAIPCNPWIRAFYQRLVAAGKPKKVAIIACMRKLLDAVHTSRGPG